MQPSESAATPADAPPTTVLLAGDDDEARAVINLAIFMGERVDVVAVGLRAMKLWEVVERYDSARVRPVHPGLLIDRTLDASLPPTAGRTTPDLLVIGGEALLMRHSGRLYSDDPAWGDDELLAERDGRDRKALDRRIRETLGLQRDITGDTAWARVVGATVAAATSSGEPVLLTDEAMRFAADALQWVDPNRIRMLLTPRTAPSSEDEGTQRDLGAPSAAADQRFTSVAQRVLSLASVYTTTAVPFLGEIPPEAAMDLREELDESLVAFRIRLREVAGAASGIADGESFCRYLSEAAVQLETAYRAYVRDVERNTVRRVIASRWPTIVGGAAGTGTTVGLTAALGLVNPTVVAVAATFAVSQLVTSIGEKVAASRQLRSAPLYWVLQLERRRRRLSLKP